MTLPQKITGPWTLADLNSEKLGTPKNGFTVFSCFHCGGGSSMGYKLAGFNVLGGVEIDPEMMTLYRKNLNPNLAFSYQMPIQKFKELKDLPSELFNLDILDGSPPCSSFSMAGSREKTWGKKKIFREGQAKQVLDDLFFHFIDVANKLQPKVVVAENVKGLIQGNAKGYVREIFDHLSAAGYETQLFLLNSASMGVPQVRERTFFISRRKNLKLPPVVFRFNEPKIKIKDAFTNLVEDVTEMSLGSVRKKYNSAPIGGYPKSSKGNTFGFIYRSHPMKPSATITAQPRAYHWRYCRRFNSAEVIRIQSFPDDYNFIKSSLHHANYVCGMSVPPLMMQRVALVLAQLLRSSVKR